MAFGLFLLLFSIPLIEISLFIIVGGAIGLVPTLLIVLLSAVLGTFMIRIQGFRTWQQARTTMDRGEMPVRELFDGLCIFTAGVLLLTPGFFTDALGVLLLVPLFRTLLAERLVRHMVIVKGGDTGRTQRPVIIETDYHEVDQDPDKRD